MKDEIFKTFKINETVTYEFREICGLTFVFGEKIYTMRDRLTSAEIKPVGIIYEENGEFYLAPLDKTINIETIVEEYVKNFLKKII